MHKEITAQTQKPNIDMPNTSAKLYGNPFLQYKVMAWTKKKLGRTD